MQTEGGILIGKGLQAPSPMEIVNALANDQQISSLLPYCICYGNPQATYR